MDLSASVGRVDPGVRADAPAMIWRMLRWGGAILGLAAFASLWVLDAYEADREIRQMPAAERSVLYSRTYETLANVCTRTRTPTLLEHCQAQAQFIVRFPECDMSCAQLAKQFGPRATK